MNVFGALYFSIFCLIFINNTLLLRSLKHMERSEDYQINDLNFDLTYLGDPSLKQQTSFRNIDQNEDFCFSFQRGGRKEKKNLREDEITQLEAKKKALEQFIHRIGEVASLPIREDILQHCQKVSLQIPHNLNRGVVMKLVKNRVDKMIKNKRIKKNWSEEDVNILIWVISKYCQFHGFLSIKESLSQADWNNIADMIPGVTGKSCMFKWLSLKKSNLAQNSWLEEQSLLLDEVVKKNGETNWCLISQELYTRNPFSNKVYRCPKQCREHWNCYLNPQLKKGPWEKKEDYLLLRAVKQLQGVKKWAEIVKLFDGRTQNALKNRFTLVVQKEMRELKNRKKASQIQVVDLYLKKNEQYDCLGDSAIKFLKQIRNQINQNQQKKKPKKHRIKKGKEFGGQSQSIVSQNEEEEQYIPVDNSWRGVRAISKGFKTRNIDREVQQMNDQQQSVSYNMYPEKEREYSINRMNQLNKQEQIFYSEDESSHDNARSLNKQKAEEEEKGHVVEQKIEQMPDNRENFNANQLDEEARTRQASKQYFEYLMRGNLNYAWMFVNQESNKNVNNSEVSFIPYTEALNGTIKSNSATIIPCSISQANGRYLIKYLQQ